MALRSLNKPQTGLNSVTHSSLMKLWLFFGLKIITLDMIIEKLMWFSIYSDRKISLIAVSSFFLISKTILLMKFMKLLQFWNFIQVFICTFRLWFWVITLDVQRTMTIDTINSHVSFSGFWPLFSFDLNTNELPLFLLPSWKVTSSSI